MKFRVTFKTPNALDHAVNKAMQRMSERLSEEDLSHDDVDGLLEEKAHEMHATASKWVKDEELVTIEFDTTLDTATVVKP